ncbi:MAG TPA: DUF1616 domain-containing protein [archaeon]|nr:DUF1616 domain-containing protein [archaeon]
MVLELVSGFASLAFVLFVPGYFLTLGFFPSKKELDGIERFTFSIVFSMFSLPFLLLILNQVFSVPLELNSVIYSIAAIILIGLISYLIRIQKISVPSSLNYFFPKIDKNDAVPIIPKFS